MDKHLVLYKTIGLCIAIDQCCKLQYAERRAILNYDEQFPFCNIIHSLCDLKETKATLFLIFRLKGVLIIQYYHFFCLSCTRSQSSIISASSPLTIDTLHLLLSSFLYLKYRFLKHNQVGNFLLQCNQPVQQRV